MEKLTQKEQIKKYIGKNPGKTATEISKATGIRPASVSSVLIKALHPSGPFKRKKPEGNKGWIYFVTP